jgi:hypothetical protein
MKHPQQFRFLVIAIAALVAATTLDAIKGNEVESALRAYPVLRDASGRKIADGNFAQSVENDGLHVQIAYAGDGRKIEETAVLRQRPELAQQRWRWNESLRGDDIRTFEVDFASGMATAVKMEKGEPRRWSEKLDITEGETFAGFGFTLAGEGAARTADQGRNGESESRGLHAAAARRDGGALVRGARFHSNGGPYRHGGALRDSSQDSSAGEVVRESAGCQHLADAAAGGVRSL